VALRKEIAAKSADQPLIIAFGSSLTSLGLRPEALDSCRPSNPVGPLVYNFGMPGTTVIGQLMCLKRLLAEDIRPDWGMVEIYPRHFLLSPDAKEPFVTRRLNREDIPLVSEYFPGAHEVRKEWREAQLLPWFSNRNTLQNLVVPTWMPRRLHEGWRYTDQWGWRDNPVLVATLKAKYAAPDFAENTAKSLDAFNHENISPQRDAALRELLALCKRERLGVVMVRVPESSYYRNAYAATTKKAIDRWLKDVVAQTGVAVIDASEWLPDSQFADGFHVDADGASQFTRRLETEWIQKQNTASPHVASNAR
jgi:hypothetical protein